jgi:hypothetical protein
VRDLFNIPESFTGLSDVDLAAWINAAVETAARIGSNPDEFTTGDDALTRDELMAVATEGVAAIAEARGELAGRTPAVEPTDDDFAALAAQAAEHAVEEDDEEPEEPAEPEAEAAAAVEELEVEEPEAAAVEEPETVVATAGRTRALARPRRARVAAPVVEEPRVALTAAAENLGFGLGAELGSTPEEMGKALARMMIRGASSSGRSRRARTATRSRSHARSGRTSTRRSASSRGTRPTTSRRSRRSSPQPRSRRRSRRAGRSTADRSSRPAVSAPPSRRTTASSCSRRPAGRCGRRCRRSTPTAAGSTRTPAALPAITTAVGYHDGRGGRGRRVAGTKTCQVVDCPTSRRPTSTRSTTASSSGTSARGRSRSSWRSGTRSCLAAQARVADSALLDGINDASTQVTAGDDGLGASAALPSQIIVGGGRDAVAEPDGPGGVLRVLLPNWVLDLLVSDQSTARSSSGST